MQTLCVNDSFVPSDGQMMSWSITRGFLERDMEGELSHHVAHLAHGSEGYFHVV